MSDNELKILMIGNSYSDDTVKWVHEICESININVTIANMYIGGCSLSTHLSNLQNDSEAYEFVVYDKSIKQWERRQNTSISQALKYDKWNYISLQQSSPMSGLKESYDIIDNVIDEVLKIKNDSTFIWNMTWAYQQGSNHHRFPIYDNSEQKMHNCIIDCIQNKVKTNKRIKKIIPVGNAIQNARTSAFRDMICRDSSCHLSLEFGRFIAGLSLVGCLTGADLTQVTNFLNLPLDMHLVAIESAINALNNPFTITKTKNINK